MAPNAIYVQDGRIIPGDRVMYVHTPLATTHLTRASLDVAVQALKGAPLGPVKIGETRQQFCVVRKGQNRFSHQTCFPGVCKPKNIDASYSNLDQVTWRAITEKL